MLHKAWLAKSLELVSQKLGTQHPHPVVFSNFAKLYFTFCAAANSGPTTCSSSSQYALIKETDEPIEVMKVDWTHEIFFYETKMWLYIHRKTWMQRWVYKYDFLRALFPNVKGSVVMVAWLWCFPKHKFFIIIIILTTRASARISMKFHRPSHSLRMWRC